MSLYERIRLQWGNLELLKVTFWKTKVQKKLPSAEKTQFIADKETFWFISCKNVHLQEENTTIRKSEVWCACLELVKVNLWKATFKKALKY